MHEPTYDEVLLSGYTAGYESGYTDGQEECGPDYSREYFTIEALEDGNLTVRKACDYSINGGEWVSMTGETAITLHEGDKVRFRGESDVLKLDMFSGNTTFVFTAYGNIESLEYGDDFIGRKEISSSRMFESLFLDCQHLTSAENMILPATALTGNCYLRMFFGCSSLTTAPVLPATTLARSCYYEMFNSCTSLTTAPELPATALASTCYSFMFWNCISLISAPALPATALEQNCYQGMFNGCTSLSSAPELPATELTLGCYNYMFSGCTSLTTAPELHATTMANTCYQNMFKGCTSLTRAPELPATILWKRCYQNMFFGCSSLNYIKCLATNISASGSLSDWVANVSPTGTFVKAAGASWPTGNSGIPDGWTVIEE